MHFFQMTTKPHHPSGHQARGYDYIGDWRSHEVGRPCLWQPLRSDCWSSLAYQNRLHDQPCDVCIDCRDLQDCSASHPSHCPLLGMIFLHSIPRYFFPQIWFFWVLSWLACSDFDVIHRRQHCRLFGMKEYQIVSAWSVLLFSADSTSWIAQVHCICQTCVPTISILGQLIVYIWYRSLANWTGQSWHLAPGSRQCINNLGTILSRRNSTMASESLSPCLFPNTLH